VDGAGSGIRSGGAASQGQEGGGGKQARVDMNTLARPIDMHDTVWIEDMPSWNFATP